MTRSRLPNVTRALLRNETVLMVAMALLVGLGGGFGAVGFRMLIDIAGGFFFGTMPRWLAFLGPYHVVLMPALGGLMVGLMAHVGNPEIEGPGVSSVMEALALRGGRMPPLIIGLKPVATSLTIGSGGSAGREGPIVQIGSAIGSTLSQIVDLAEDQTKNLVACGAAAGIAATFNAPLAGVMFALEILLANFGLIQFSSVAVAAVVGSVVGHAAFGDAPAFSFPLSAPPNVWELPIYALLGVAAAFVGVGFSRARYWVDDLFDRWSGPRYLRPCLGGLLVGFIGLWFPQILGIGYDSIEAVLFGRLRVGPLVGTAPLVLGAIKIVATSITIGSGGSGGIFAPSLFIGAMLGGLFGQAVHQAAPAAPVPSAYALVGMSAVFGAASRAPITATLTLFEMTRDYNAILPLMLSTVISAVVARHLSRESIYTVKLSRRGIDVYAQEGLDLMGTIRVGEAMTPIEEMPTVTPDTSLAELARVFDEHPCGGVPVVNRDRRLQGMVTLSDLGEAQAQGRLDATVGAIYAENVRTAFRDETLEDALRRFGALATGSVPVVDRTDPGLVVGVLGQGDILRAYSDARMDA